METAEGFQAGELGSDLSFQKLLWLQNKTVGQSREMGGGHRARTKLHSQSLLGPVIRDGERENQDSSRSEEKPKK